MCYPKWRIKQAEEKLDIVDLIRYYGVQLSTYQNGNNYKAKCPFHEDSGYSLCVNKGKKLYFCPGCRAGGNLFTFLQKQEKQLNFPEIVKLAFAIADEIKAQENNQFSN